MEIKQLPLCNRTLGMICRLIWLLLLTSLSSAIAAAENEDNNKSPPVEQPIELLDNTHSTIHENLKLLADRIDRFFGDERIDIESEKDRFRMDISTIHREGGVVDYDGRLRAKLELPRTKRRFNLIIETDPEEAFEEDPERIEQSARLTDTSETEYSAVLRYLNEKSKLWNLNTDIGVKFRFPLDPFTRMRASRAKQFDNWLVRFTETLFWFNSIGLGETSRLDFERPLNEALYFRSTSEATWLHDLEGFELEQNFTLFQKISDKTAIAYRAGVFGETRPNTRVTGYLLNMQIRKNIYKDWLFFQVTPQAFYPEEEDFELSPSITFTLEANFE